MKYRFGFYIKYKLLQCNANHFDCHARPRTAHKTQSVHDFRAIGFGCEYIYIYGLNNLQVADFRHFSPGMELRDRTEQNEYG